MTDITPGQINVLTAIFYSAPNVPVDVTGLTMQVLNLTDNTIALGPINSGFGHPATGIYTVQWNVPLGQMPGPYLVTWSGTVSGSPISAVEELTVVTGPFSGDDFYSSGPCHPYEYISFCTIPTEAVAISGYALEAASEILYLATGQRFDSCQVTIRPCRKECSGVSWPYLSSAWWDVGGYGGGPRPALINGAWYNIACGVCGENCSCTMISETLLPGPVQQIVQVTVDGVVLVPNVDYRIDDYRKLVRLGGVWPLCNDLNKDITEIGTWSVTAIYGEPLPTLGKLAAGELFCDILADLLGGECALPDSVTELTRQGVTMTFETAQEALESGFEGLKYVDRFIRRYNPDNLRTRPMIYDLDSPTFRVTGTQL